MTEPTTPEKGSRSRLVAITLDEKSTATSNPNIEHEREVAIFDILEENSFAVEGRDDGPYTAQPRDRRGPARVHHRR